MSNSQYNRPQTSITRNQISKYRNKSHIQFGQSDNISQLNCDNKEITKKRRPQSYRNISKIGQYMTDTIPLAVSKQKVHYVNLIQNISHSYQIPKNQRTDNQNSQQFKDFLQRNGSRIYKPVDQFCQYSDLIMKNSTLLRRGQFNIPLRKEQTLLFKGSTKTPTENSKYFTKYSKMNSTKSKFRLGNTISSTLKQSNKQKKNLQKQRQEFHYSTQKHIKPINKTFLGYADEYTKLINKQRYQTDKLSLNNSMSRVLTMQVMGKQIQNLTHMYI